MVEINFYHLTSTPLEKALPKLLEKVVDSGNRVCISTIAERIENIDKVLWNYSSKTFLAHGTENDPYPEIQPIYITASNDNPNGANILAIIDSEPLNIEEFEKCIDMFDGNSEEGLKKAKERLSKYKKLGFTITYWQQGIKGNWEKK